MEILSDTTFKGNVSIEGRTDVKSLKIIDPDGYPISYVTTSEFYLIKGSLIANNDGLILSSGYDAEFGGNVTFSESVTFYNTEFHCSSATFNKKVTFNSSINLNCSISVKNGTYSQGFQCKSGVIALTSDIDAIRRLISDAPGVKIRYCNGINRDVPTNCTLFKVDIGGTVNGVVNATVEKRYGEAGGCTLIDGCFWENTDIDIFQSTAHPKSTFFIRKAAGSMAQEDGIIYSLKVVHT